MALSVCQGGSACAPANLELAEYSSVRELQLCKFLLVPKSLEVVLSSCGNRRFPVADNPVSRDLNGCHDSRSYSVVFAFTEVLR
jgi:hypothetical protein